MSATATLERARPPLAVALGGAILLVAATAWVRIAAFPEDVIPLTDGLALLTCLWHRDRRLLWGMTAAFIAIFWVKFHLVLPPDSHPQDNFWLFLSMHLSTVLLLSWILDGLLRGQVRTESLVASLTASNEELTAREEEITRQNEELQSQAEELEQQAEELAAQAEELQALNHELGRREASLQTLLDASGPGASEDAVMVRLCEAVQKLIGSSACAAAILEREDSVFHLRASSGFGPAGSAHTALPADRTLAALVLARGQSGGIPDLALRPDILTPQPLDGRTFRSLLAVPMRLQGEYAGALEVYGTEVQTWEPDQFRLAEWIAEQASRVWEAARMREERTRLDAEVARQRDFLETLIENIPMAVAVAKGPEYRYVLANPAFRAIPGRQDQPVLGQSIDEVFPEAAADLRRIFDEVARTGRPWTLREYAANVGPGREQTWWTGEILRQADQTLLILTTEVTDQVLALRRLEDNERRYRALAETLERRVGERTAELERRAAQLQTLATELTRAEQRERTRLAKLLHDHLQQLLVAAKLRVGLLPRLGIDHDLPTATREVESLLADSIDTVRTLTAELSPLVLQDRGLAPALEWLGRWMRDKHRLEVDLELDHEAEPASDTVRILLYEAVRELLLNVVKHAGVNRARVVLRREPPGRVKLLVEDHGAGFDPTSLHLGQQISGGFGLFSIRERLDTLGGRMVLDSAPGRGAQVVLLAPVRLRSPESPAVPVDEDALHVVEPEPRPGGPIRVLLADDHRILRQGLVSLLAFETDIEVVAEAADGRQAVELALRLSPDVVIMDVSMPIMDGVEATRRITSDQPNVRVIGLSLHESADMARAMRDAGAAAYLSKGGPADVLVATIRGYSPDQPGMAPVGGTTGRKALPA